MSINDHRPDESSIPADLGEFLAANDALPEGIIPVPSIMEDAFLLNERQLGAIEPCDAERSWAAVSEQMNARNTRAPIAKRAWRESPWKQRAALLSAGFVAVLALVVGLRHAGTSAASDTPMQVVTTGRGERATVELGDGSVIRLSAGSTVRYRPSRNASDQLVVKLDGEAFFEIRHGDQAPFVVVTRNAHTRVLGTAFGVRQYMGDDETRVTVAEGKVGVRQDRGAGTETAHERALTKGQMAIIDAYTISISPSTLRNLAWRNGRVEFEDTPLPVALRELERWYDVRFVVNDPNMMRQHINATFTTDSLEKVTRILGLLLGAPVVRADTTLIIG